MATGMSLTLWVESMGIVSLPATIQAAICSKSAVVGATSTECAFLLENKSFIQRPRNKAQLAHSSTEEAQVLHAVLAENCIHELYCVTCALGAERSRWWKLDTYACALCKMDKQRNEFAAVDLQLGSVGSRGCEACKYPVCAICKQQSEDHQEYRQWKRSVKSHKDDQSRFTCMACKYPPCHACKIAERPHKKEKYTVRNLPEWLCKACKRKME